MKAYRAIVDSARYAPTSLFPTHRPLILNWFRLRRLIALGAVEGFNNKLKLTTRRSYGFRVFRVVEIALYHALGKLPEPEGTQRFC